MSKTFTRRGHVLAMSLLAASGLAAAADEAPGNPPLGQPGHHQRLDPVARTQHKLDGLARKLNLTQEQQAAWQAYSDSTISRAKEMTQEIDEHRGHRGEGRAEPDTATRLDEMSRAMRERADTLQKVAQDTRAFQGALSPDQKTIFDLYWKAQMHQRMGHRPPA